MSPIETRWGGYVFRSRTEARWAVFLTAARIRFDYEREGYALPSGWYLPDFWLPERKCWLEIKGQDPTEREWALLRELSAHTGHSAYIAVGPPNEDDVEQICFREGDVTATTQLFYGTPASAYQAARADRFDGRAKTQPSPPPPPKRWW